MTAIRSVALRDRPVLAAPTVSIVMLAPGSFDLKREQADQLLARLFELKHLADEPPPWRIHSGHRTRLLHEAERRVEPVEREPVPELAC